jgi:predicted N-acetyltransferase YhbS
MVGILEYRWIKMTSIKLSELEIKIMAPEDDIGIFNCEDDDLNGFIKDDAINQMNANMNVTYLCNYNGQVVGFFTLSADSVKVNMDDIKGLRKKHIKYWEFPAVKIGRLAVSNQHQKRGIGTNLLLMIIGKADELSEHIGIRYVSVDAYMGSVKFYKERFFTEFIQDGKRNTVQMYLDLLKMEQLPE